MIPEIFFFLNSSYPTLPPQKKVRKFHVKAATHTICPCNIAIYCYTIVTASNMQSDSKYALPKMHWITCLFL